MATLQEQSKKGAAIAPSNTTADMRGQEHLLSRLTTADPGLPRPFARAPYWLHAPHPLAEHHSPALVEEACVVVIGSGITGASVAHTLLESDPTIRVVVLEARSLCSGATGRNGGHMVAYAGADYAALKVKLGAEEALSTIDFTLRTLDDTMTLIHQRGWEEDVEYRPVTRIRTFADAEGLEAARASITEFVSQRPDMERDYEVIGSDQTRDEYGIHDVAGAVLLPAHAIWPYKFVSKVFQRLVDEYPSRFYLETNTPVLSVQYRDPNCRGTGHAYSVRTPRGTVQATHIVHATNGYAGHLLPGLRGRLYPHQGSMTVQDFGTTIPNRGGEYTWSHHHEPRYDSVSKTTTLGTYYLQQNARSGYMIFGGERTTAVQSVSADDTQPVEQATQHLRCKLASLLRKEAASAHLVSEWRGVMGYTADRLPLVGPVPRAMSYRGGNGEWIAAGFNGMGMCYAWGSGKATAKVILGAQMSNWIPKAFMLSEERLNHSLHPEASVEGLLRCYPPTVSTSDRSARL
ncbi:FAD dependent oxidoreductase-domain-containing protein [Aspergillus similis]